MPFIHSRNLPQGSRRIFFHALHSFQEPAAGYANQGVALGVPGKGVSVGVDVAPTVITSKVPMPILF